MQDLQWSGFLRSPHEVKATAIGLWVYADGLGRTQLIPELIAAAIYPGEAATSMVEDHLLILDEVGFLKIYRADGDEWIQLLRPLKVDSRLAWSNAPEPPQYAVRERSRTFAIEGRERAEAWAREQVRAGDVERDRAWQAAEDARRAPVMPDRPFLLDAPPIGCPEHPAGHNQSCGPCRDARLNREVWVVRQRHTKTLANYFEHMQGGSDDLGYVDEEPF